MLFIHNKHALLHESRCPCPRRICFFPCFVCPNSAPVRNLLVEFKRPGLPDMWNSSSDPRVGSDVNSLPSTYAGTHPSARGIPDYYWQDLNNPIYYSEPSFSRRPNVELKPPAPLKIKPLAPPEPVYNPHPSPKNPHWQSLESAPPPARAHVQVKPNNGQRPKIPNIQLQIPLPPDPIYGPNKLTKLSAFAPPHPNP